MNHRKRITFVINGGPSSAMAERAAAFSRRLAERFTCSSVFRSDGKLHAIGRMARAIATTNPDICYVLDLAISGVAAAALNRIAGNIPFVLDTGDAVVELGKALGRGWLGTTATKVMETYALRNAAAVVVRGSYHRDLLGQRSIRATFIPDGVAVDRFAPSMRVVRSDDSERPLVIGLVGSSVWIPVRQTCYGSELLEVVRFQRPSAT